MPDLPGTMLILTGPPGAGKSTVARQLTLAARTPAVHLHTDDFWHFIRNGLIPPYEKAADAQNAIVVDVIARAAEGYANGGYFVVVDGIVGPWFLPAFNALARPCHYVILRPRLDDAVQRCRLRGGGQLSDPEVITAMHAQFADLGRFESHVIETAGHDIDATERAVWSALTGGRCRLGS